MNMENKKTSDQIWDEAVGENKLVIECSNCKLEITLPHNISIKRLNDEAEIFARQHRTRIGNMWCKKDNLFVRTFKV
jgi:hypothetical protein